MEKLLFRMLGSKEMVALGKWALGIGTSLKLPIAWALRPTIYNHFVGGEDLDDCLPLLNKLRDRDVFSLLDYSAEGGSTDKDTMNTYNENMAAIRFAVEHRDQLSHAVIKASGLIDVELLVKKNENPAQLTDEENDKIELFHSRFMALCREAYDLDIRLVIDAEHYAYQSIIDAYTEEAMLQFNQHKAIVYATLQMYRKDRWDYLQHLEQLSREKDIYIGAKLVRGAYMEEERERAKEKGYPDPIHDCKENTDDAYNKAAAFVLDHIDHFELFAGTHNEESLLRIASRIDEKGLDRNDPRIYMAQLYGMGDHFTFNLSRAGYNAAKYVPYAPVDKATPYLIRRAEENTSIRGQVGRELMIRTEELKRRKKEP